MAKPDKEMAAARLDIDDYDAFADHLVVIDRSSGHEQIVGTYRLLRQELADKYGNFYSSAEYELDSLISSGKTLLELGRSCVLPEYRTRPVLNLLWQGIADFITEHKVDLMFGCASLHSTDIKYLSQPLSYLYHHHLAPAEIRPRAVKGRYINMNIVPLDELDRKKVFGELPPLIKGYLRLGATIGDGAVIDEQFNTTDVCIVVQTHQVTARYRKHYERKIQKPMHRGDLTDIKDLPSYIKGSA
jgi:putative hemolysin